MLPVQYYHLYKVVVRVTDINDHAPIFHQDSVVLNISESTPPGTRFSLPVADDSDSEQYGVVEYRLEPSQMQPIFALHVVTEADGSQQVCKNCRVTYLLPSPSLSERKYCVARRLCVCLSVCVSAVLRIVSARCGCTPH